MSKSVIVRCLVTSPGAALGFAKKLGRELAASVDKVRTRIFDGLIVRAVKQTNGSVIVTILEIPGIWLFGADFVQSRHTYLPSGYIDGFSALSIFYRAGSISKAVAEPKDSDVEQEFDIAKISGQTGQKVFAFGSSNAGTVIQSNPGIVLAHSNVATRAQFFIKDSSGSFGSSCGVISTAITAAVARTPAVKEEGEDVQVPTAKNAVNYQTLVLDDSFSESVFGNDVRFGVPIRNDYATPYIPYDAVMNPPMSFMIRNKDTKKITDMVVVAPVVRTRVPPQNPDATPESVTQLYGHAVIVADLSITDEQRQTEASEFPAVIKTSDHRLLTDYAGLVSPGMTYPQAAREVEPDEFGFYPVVEWEPEKCYTNWIRQLSATVVESASDTPPDPIPPTPPDERPAYYGDTKILVLSSTVHTYSDSSGLFPNFYTQRATTLHTYTLSDSGLSHSETVLDTSTKLIREKFLLHEGGDPDFYPDYDVSTYPLEMIFEGRRVGYTAENSLVDIRYCYAPSGPGLPTVVITVDARGEAAESDAAMELLPATDIGHMPPGESVLTITDIGSSYEGDLVGGSARFEMVYADGEIVAYDLGGYAPPRPLLKGVHFDGYFSQKPVFTYNSSVLGDENRTVYFPQVTPSYPIGNPAGAEPTRSDYAFYDTPSNYEGPSKQSTRRRIITEAEGPITQKIHAHCGAGVTAVLVTDEVITGVTCAWYVAMAKESSGELMYVGGNIFTDSKFGDQLPLESSNWISLSLLRPMKRDADGNITQEAVLLCSIQPPRQVVAGYGVNVKGGDEAGLSIHLYQGRLYSITMTDAISERRHIDTYSEQRISRDSGRTWQTFIKGMPGDGFYLGSALRPEELTR